MSVGSDGLYRFQGVETGSYVVIVAAPAHQPEAVA
jgi:hypothetical protein